MLYPPWQLHRILPGRYEQWGYSVCGPRWTAYLERGAGMLIYNDLFCATWESHAWPSEAMHVCVHVPTRPIQGKETGELDQYTTRHYLQRR